MKLVRAFLLITSFLLLSMFVFSQSIQDFKGVWQGRYTEHWGVNQDTTYNVRFNFSEASGKTLSGTASIYDNSVPMKLIGNSDDFEVTYNSKDNSFSYDNTTETPDGKRCKGKYVYHLRTGVINSLVGEFIPSKNGCVQINALLTQAIALHSQPGLVINSKSENKLDTSSTNLNKQIAPTPYKQTFKILPQWVTHPTDAQFKWFNWNDAPEDLKIATNYENTYTDRTTSKLVPLSETAELYIKNGCKIKIAALDLDNNGVCGLVIYAQGSWCCGSGGCAYDLFDNGGLSSVFLEYSPLENDVTPSQNGIKLNTADFSVKVENFYPLRSNTSIPTVNRNATLKLFSYDTTGLNLNTSTPKYSNGSLVGGSTPNELGKILFKALKTNDKKLWMSCIHPVPQKNYPNIDQLIKTFDEYREALIESGVEDWNLLRYSRVTFKTVNAEGESKLEIDGEKALYNLTVEFFYKGTEFIGAFEINVIETYKRQNYFMHNRAFGRIALIRNNLK